MAGPFETLKRLVTFQPGPSPVTVKSIPDGVEVFGPMGQRAADWNGVSNNTGLHRSYRLCATAYACATFLADAVAEAPLRVYKIVDGDLQELPQHRMRILLANPNPYLSEAELMGVTVMSMAMYGYGIVEKVRSAARIPVQLWPIRPDWLTREKRNDGVTQWVLRKPNTDPRAIAEEDLIFIPYRHDERQEQVGVSPLQIVAREIGIDVALTDLLKVFLDAGGIPPWAVEIPDANPKQPEVDAFREMWKQRYGGWSAYNTIGILYGGMKLVKVGDSIGDMAWPELRGLTEMKIAQAFRVPADLIQARDSMKSGSLTTTEIDGAMAALQMYGASPLRSRIDGAFTRGLLPDFTGGDTSLTVEFDTTAIMSMQEDRDALHARVRADFDAGAITLNQYLQETGRPEIGTPGEVYKVQFTTMFVSARDLTGSNDTTPAPPKTTVREIPRKHLVYVDRKSMSADVLELRTKSLATTNRTRNRLTEIGTRKLRTFFKQQGERMVAALKSADGIDVKAALVDWDEEESLLDDLMEKFYGETGKAAFGQAASTTGTSISWDLANPNVSRIMDQLGTRIVGINETTQADVQKVISDGLANGLNHVELAKELESMFTDGYKGRAATIARTESMIAYNKASVLGYSESGVVDQVELVDNRDHVDSYGASDGLTCAERDGLKVDLADVDGHIEAEHPNGSLAVIPLLNMQLGA